MFDDAYGMIERCAETFRCGVRDAFGASISSDVLDPIRDQIGLLRFFHEEFQRRSLGVEQLLQTARSMPLDEGFQL